jgi:hypothetical protein
MIHITNLLIKIIATMIFGSTIGGGLIILTLLFWDKEYMEASERILSHIWKKI